MSNHRKQAFLRGFASGMASPFTVFLPPPQSRYEGIASKDLVARSWKQVGMALESAMNAERQTHGEATLPSTASTVDRVLKTAEHELKHSSNMERSVFDAAQKDFKRGMNYGTGLFAALIVCAFGSLFVTDNPLVPGIFLGTATVGGVTALIRGRG